MNSSLYPQIVSLIEAYEKGLINSIKSSPSDTNAHVLYMSPLRNMEATLEVSDAGHETAVLGLTSQEEAKEAYTGVDNFNEVENTEKDVFYQECKLGAPHRESGYAVSARNSDINVFKTKSNPRLGLVAGQKEGFRYKAGVYKDKRISQAFDSWLSKDNDGIVDINGWKTNFSIEECLDCLIDIELEVLIPPIEWTFSLTKLLRQIRDLLNEIKTAMDPTTVFEPFCQFLAAIKENGLCPKNLPALQLILPTLFSKYSFDLAKIRLSWTGLMGPVMKGVIAGIVSSLENIPRLANPFLDCIINSLTNFNKWIKTYLMSADKIASEVGKGFVTVDKLITRAGDWLDMSTTSSAEQKALIEEMKSNIKYLDKLDSGTDITAQRLTDSYEDFLDSFISTLSENAKEGDITQLYNQMIRFAIQNKILLIMKEETVYAFKVDDFDNLQNLEDYERFLEFIYTNENVESQSGRQTLREEYNQERLTLQRQQEARKSLFAGSRVGPLNDPITWFDDGDKSTGVPGTRKTLLNEEEQKLLGTPFATKQYNVPALDKYELQGKVNYLPIDSTYFKQDWFELNLNKNYESSAMNKLLEKVMIPKVKECKIYINNITKKIIATFKSLEKFIDEYITADLKIAGQILELLHVIRFIKVIYSFIRNDWSCDDIKDNPEVMNNTLGNEPIVFKSEVESVRKQPVTLESSQKNIVVGSTNNKYSTVVDMTDCKNMFSKLNLNDFNLDAIYESMINA